METYELASLRVTDASGHTYPVPFGQAKLVVVTDYGNRLWYIDADGVTDDALLRAFAESERIDVDIAATTIGGRKLEGQGFLHPNPANRAAAIRGNGELRGYPSPGVRA